MGWKIQRAKAITEVLELCDANGGTVAEIAVEADVDKIAAGYRKAEIAIVNAQTAAQNAGNDAYMQLGAAITSLFQLIFGESGTDKIIEYFDGRYTEMLLQVMPFIREVVVPAVQKAAVNKRATIADAYSMNRFQRRKFGAS